MITSDLVIYIQKQLRKNISKDLIILHLTEKGWRREDIEEGFIKVESISNLIDSNETKKETTIDQNDKYRELPVVDDQPSVLINTQISSEPKVWVPMGVKTQEQSTPNIEIKNEIPKVEITEKVVSIENKNIPVEETSGYSLSAVSFNQNKKTFSDFKTSNVSTIKQVPSDIPLVKNTSTEILKPITTPSLNIPKPQTTIQNLSTKTEIPILTSFKKDLLSANIKQSEIVKTKNKNIFKYILIILVISLLFGGLGFAFMNNYIKIPSFIKKDPKVILLNTATAFNSLKSYKIETDINLSSPSFANITSGLVNGEAVVSNDKDFISINTKGVVNRNNSSSLTLDYNSVIKSSFFKDDINTNLKYDGVKSYIKIPNLSSTLSDNYFPAGNVSLAEDQFDLITKELSSDFQEKVNKFNVFGVITKIISGSLGSKISSPFKDFINSAIMIEKTNEIIKGQDSYHYEVVVDRQNTKKLLVAMVSTFAKNKSSDVKGNLEEILGSMTIDSFEVWVGKSDNSILQYRFILSVPLSKIIGLEGKDIGNNKVSLDWKTTYYDFNTPNTIVMPTDYIKITDYIKSIHDEKIKNTISSFYQNSTALLNAEGSLGKHSNKLGSCTSPDSGSIFSPLGHTKGASTAVGAIANTMNNLLSVTENPSACYSTLTKWAISSPLVSNPQSFFCIDDTGVSKTLDNQISGSVCVASTPKSTTEETSLKTPLN